MARARAFGLDDRVTPFVADADRELPAGPFDLITACFFYPAGNRAAILHRLSSLVQPGGMLVIVDHASVAPWSWNQHAHEFPTPQQTLATLGLDERWSPIRLAVVPRTATALQNGRPPEPHTRPGGHRPMPLDRACRNLRRVTDGHSRRPRREHRAPARTGRPAPDAVQPIVGHHHLHPHLRRAAPPGCSADPRVPLRRRNRGHVEIDGITSLGTERNHLCRQHFHEQGEARIYRRSGALRS